MDESTTTSISPIPGQPLKQLKLFYRGREFTLTEEDLPFVLGRDSVNCQLFIDDKEASRKHCSIAIVGDQVGILDSSTNGTSIQTGRANSIRLKDSFYPLTGRGSILLGKEITANDPNLIHYKIAFKTPIE